MELNSKFLDLLNKLGTLDGITPEPLQSYPMILKI